MEILTRMGEFKSRTHSAVLLRARYSIFGIPEKPENSAGRR